MGHIWQRILAHRYVHIIRTSRKGEKKVEKVPPYAAATLCRAGRRVVRKLCVYALLRRSCARISLKMNAIRDIVLFAALPSGLLLKRAWLLNGAGSEIVRLLPKRAYFFFQVCESFCEKRLQRRVFFYSRCVIYTTHPFHLKNSWVLYCGTSI